MEHGTPELNLLRRMDDWREEGEARIVPDAPYLALVRRSPAALSAAQRVVVRSIDQLNDAAWSRSRCNSGTVPLR
jgi:hypothetical protein